ncbi:MAG: DUF418 domain-containing protein [Pseudomonadota bacterium]
MPENSTDRIITIDALRGFALFGILYAHMIFWYAGGALPEQLYKENYGIPSGITLGFYFIFVLAKFFSIFSFLFGLSFYIQLKSLMKRNDNFILRFSWRLLILGIIGFIHHTLWRADILSIYVPLGFLLIFARNLSNRTLLVIGFMLILNLPTKIYEIISLFINGQLPFSNAPIAEEGAHYYEIMKNAPFLEVALDNIKALPTKLNYQISSGRLLITFGFFLLGMFAGRMQWFENLNETKPVFQKIWKKTGLILLVAIAIGILLGALSFSLGLNLEKNPWAMWVAGLFADIFNSGLTLFYITGFTLLMYRKKWIRFLSPLANVGKMALTSYLMQTLFGLLIFFSFGLGLFTKTTPAINTLISFGIFGLQIIFSHWWLKRFHYGPIEWLWRSATFLKPQKMLKSDTPLAIAANQVWHLEQPESKGLEKPGNRFD